MSDFKNLISEGSYSTWELTVFYYKVSDALKSLGEGLKNGKFRKKDFDFMIEKAGSLENLINYGLTFLDSPKIMAAQLTTFRIAHRNYMKGFLEVLNQNAVRNKKEPVSESDFFSKAVDIEKSFGDVFDFVPAEKKDRFYYGGFSIKPIAALYSGMYSNYPEINNIISKQEIKQIIMSIFENLNPDAKEISINFANAVMQGSLSSGAIPSNKNLVINENPNKISRNELRRLILETIQDLK